MKLVTHINHHVTMNMTFQYYYYFRGAETLWLLPMDLQKCLARVESKLKVFQVVYQVVTETRAEADKINTPSLTVSTVRVMVSSTFLI